jgi:glucoamylase
LAVLAAAVVCEAIAEPLYPRQYTSPKTQPAYVETEYDVSIQGVLNNIGGVNGQAPGAYDGVIIASPSTQEPNCKYLLKRRQATGERLH